MKDSIYGSWSTDSSAATRNDVEKEFELVARAARNELKRENERANSGFFEALIETCINDDITTTRPASSTRQ
ncbi:hypothetical protein CS8_049880 [Cupriavidus sp. 8B]